MHRFNRKLKQAQEIFKTFNFEHISEVEIKVLLDIGASNLEKLAANLASEHQNYIYNLIALSYRPTNLIGKDRRYALDALAKINWQDDYREPISLTLIDDQLLALASACIEYPERFVSLFSVSAYYCKRFFAIAHRLFEDKNLDNKKIAEQIYTLIAKHGVGDAKNIAVYECVLHKIYDFNSFEAVVADVGLFTTDPEVTLSEIADDSQLNYFNSISLEELEKSYKKIENEQVEVKRKYFSLTTLDEIYDNAIMISGSIHKFNYKLLLYQIEGIYQLAKTDIDVFLSQHVVNVNNLDEPTAKEFLVSAEQLPKIIKLIGKLLLNHNFKHLHSKCSKVLLQICADTTKHYQEIERIHPQNREVRNAYKKVLAVFDDLIFVVDKLNGPLRSELSYKLAVTAAPKNDGKPSQTKTEAFLSLIESNNYTALPVDLKLDESAIPHILWSSAADNRCQRCWEFFARTNSNWLNSVEIRLQFKDMFLTQNKNYADQCKKFISLLLNNADFAVSFFDTLKRNNELVKFLHELEQQNDRLDLNNEASILIEALIKNISLNKYLLNIPPKHIFKYVTLKLNNFNDAVRFYQEYFILLYKIKNYPILKLLNGLKQYEAAAKKYNEQWLASSSAVHASIVQHLISNINSKDAIVLLKATEESEDVVIYKARRISDLTPVLIAADTTEVLNFIDVCSDNEYLRIIISCIFNDNKLYKKYQDNIQIILDKYFIVEQNLEQLASRQVFSKFGYNNILNYLKNCLKNTGKKNERIVVLLLNNAANDSKHLIDLEKLKEVLITSLEPSHIYSLLVGIENIRLRNILAPCIKNSVQEILKQQLESNEPKIALDLLKLAFEEDIASFKEIIINEIKPKIIYDLLCKSTDIELRSILAPAIRGNLCKILAEILAQSPSNIDYELCLLVYENKKVELINALGLAKENVLVNFVKHIPINDLLLFLGSAEIVHKGQLLEGLFKTEPAWLNSLAEEELNKLDISIANFVNCLKDLPQRNQKSILSSIISKPQWLAHLGKKTTIALQAQLITYINGLQDASAKQALIPHLLSNLKRNFNNKLTPIVEFVVTHGNETVKDELINLINGNFAVCSSLITEELAQFALENIENLANFENWIDKLNVKNLVKRVEGKQIKAINKAIKYLLNKIQNTKQPESLFILIRGLFSINPKELGRLIVEFNKLDESIANYLITTSVEQKQQIASCIVKNPQWLAHLGNASTNALQVQLMQEADGLQEHSAKDELINLINGNFNVCSSFITEELAQFALENIENLANFENWIGKLSIAKLVKRVEGKQIKAINKAIEYLLSQIQNNKQPESLFILIKGLFSINPKELGELIVEFNKLDETIANYLTTAPVEQKQQITSCLVKNPQWLIHLGKATTNALQIQLKQKADGLQDNSAKQVLVPYLLSNLKRNVDDKLTAIAEFVITYGNEVTKIEFINLIDANFAVCSSLITEKLAQFALEKVKNLSNCENWASKIEDNNFVRLVKDNKIKENILGAIKYILSKAQKYDDTKERSKFIESVLTYLVVDNLDDNQFGQLCDSVDQYTRITICNRFFDRPLVKNYIIKKVTDKNTAKDIKAALTAEYRLNLSRDTAENILTEIKNKKVDDEFFEIIAEYLSKDQLVDFVKDDLNRLLLIHAKNPTLAELAIRAKAKGGFNEIKNLFESPVEIPRAVWAQEIFLDNQIQLLEEDDKFLIKYLNIQNINNMDFVLQNYKRNNRANLENVCREILNKQQELDPQVIQSLTCVFLLIRNDGNLLANFINQNIKKQGIQYLQEALDNETIYIYTGLTYYGKSILDSNNEASVDKKIEFEDFIKKNWDKLTTQGNFSTEKIEFLLEYVFKNNESFIKSLNMEQLKLALTLISSNNLAKLDIIYTCLANLYSSQVKQTLLAAILGTPAIIEALKSDKVTLTEVVGNILQLPSSSSEEKSRKNALISRVMSSPELVDKLPADTIYDLYLSHAKGAATAPELAIDLQHICPPKRKDGIEPPASKQFKGGKTTIMEEMLTDADSVSAITRVRKDSNAKKNPNVKVVLSGLNREVRVWLSDEHQGTTFKKVCRVASQHGKTKEDFFDIVSNTKRTFGQMLSILLARIASVFSSGKKRKLEPVNKDIDFSKNPYEHSELKRGETEGRKTQHAIDLIQNYSEGVGDHFNHPVGALSRGSSKGNKQHIHSSPVCSKAPVPTF